MVDKTFEEQFPSLKGLSCGEYINSFGENKRTYEESNIQSDCLDKQKVKEVIDKATDLTNKNEVNKHDLLLHLGLLKD